MTVQALSEHGVRKEGIRPEDGPEEGLRPDGVGVEPTPPEPKPPVILTAAPTPKVESDLWCKEDRLGYEAYARTIASLITHKETVPPLTIGIKAPWGAGKTSLMKQVQHLLDGYAELSEGSATSILQDWQPPEMTIREMLEHLKASVKPKSLKVKRSQEGEAYGLPARTTVWFNAWKYQTSEQIWAGMAHCIINQLTARMGVRERELFWLRLHGRRINVEEVRKKVYEVLLRKLAPMALLVIAVCVIAFWLAAFIPVALPLWRYGLGAKYGLRVVSLIWGAYTVRREWAAKLGEKAADTAKELVREPDYEGKMGYLHLVESDMREVLQLATEGSVTKEKPNGDPLVVFVDDLDRCAPNKVAEVVEAINLFLCGDYPNCIFVLGMEPGMVAAALEVANKDVIEKAQVFGLVDRTAPVGWRFMEKIVQLPIMIPPPTTEGRKGYVKSLTELERAELAAGSAQSVAAPAAARVAEAPRPAQHGKEQEAKVQEYVQKIGTTVNSKDAADRSVKVVEDAPVEERWAAKEAGNRVYERMLTATDPVVAKFAEHLAQLVDGNPRQMKRYVNVYRFYSTLRQRRRLDGVAEKSLPSDEVLAKFVEFSIHWPHAMDCLRVRVEGEQGKKITLLEKLETESRGLPGKLQKANQKATGENLDGKWKTFVGEKGMGLPSWAEERAFREFLARGESLCGSEEHGLW